MICEHCGSQVDDPVEVATPEPEDLVVTEPGRYKVDVQVGGQFVRLFGPEGNLRARVFAGGVTRQVFTGLKSLESPVLRIQALGDVFVKMPRLLGALSNQGSKRRFVQFYGPGGGGLVLEFLDGAVISRNLEYAIRGAFPSPAEPEEKDHDGRQEGSTEPERKEESDDPTGPPDVAGEGIDPEHGEPALGEEHGQVGDALPSVDAGVCPVAESEEARLPAEEGAPEAPVRPSPDPLLMEALKESIKPFTTIRKAPMTKPPKQLYYRRPSRGL